MHTIHTSFGSCGFSDFLCISHYKPMADNPTTGVWPIPMLAGFIQRDFDTQVHIKYKCSRLCFREEFLDFPIIISKAMLMK